MQTLFFGKVYLLGSNGVISMNYCRINLKYILLKKILIKHKWKTSRILTENPLFKHLIGYIKATTTKTKSFR